MVWGRVGGLSVDRCQPLLGYESRAVGGRSSRFMLPQGVVRNEVGVRGGGAWSTALSEPLR